MTRNPLHWVTESARVSLKGMTGKELEQFYNHIEDDYSDLRKRKENSLSQKWKTSPYFFKLSRIVFQGEGVPITCGTLIDVSIR